MRVYTIGDIHGQLQLLKDAHRLIEADGGQDARIVHLGDLIDRGPDSRGVVDHLMNGQAQGRDWIVLRGNHDRFLPAFLADPDWADPGLATPVVWTDHPGLGAAATLASYGVDADQPRAALHKAARAAVPVEHAEFLAGLPLWYLQDRLLFVHAGIRPGIDLQSQTEQDLVWIRKGFLDSPVDHGPLVVHGHTAIDRATHYGNRLNIDSGAAYGGPLSAVRLDADGAWLLGPGGSQPLRPQHDAS
ncbi:serine/threonine protein phosphatase [Paracoccus sp. M683]|uniref:metallophosphoesterase family protein n=1 Tax=Paracoccus sp. M683 TaxID=2594268 RepID=UPI00117CDB9C|nr:metallophosphoesterase family protein [Paracoccus sp. M683]TRW98716.1 serine/threonine protein phosphatase [Paracoccus sp. M683]